MTTRDRTESIVLLASLVFLASQGLFLLASPDLGHHLVVGEYTLHHGIPATNVFSPVNGDYPLQQHEWAFQVLTYIAASGLGMDGLAWVRLAVVLTLGWVLVGTLRSGRGYVVAAFCLSLGLFVAHARFMWRPELFSLVFLALVLRILTDFIEDRRDRLMWTPWVFVAWANFHGYFLVGLIVIGCFAVGEWADALRQRRDTARAKRLVLVGGLCTLATLVNPYHVEGTIYPVQVLIDLWTVDSHFTTTIRELKPPGEFSHHWSVKAWYPLLGVFVAACLLNGRKVRISYLLAALAIWLMARSAVRNIGLYGVVLGTLAAVQWQAALVRSDPAWLARYSRWGAVAVTVFLLGAAGFVATNRLYALEGEIRMFGAGVDVDVALDAPAHNFIRRHIPAEAQVFNSFELGSTYLWWFYPERRPFLDGNGGAYPPEFFAEYLEVASGRKPFGPFARRHDIDWVYLGLKTRLAKILYRNPDWHPVFLNGDAIILVNEAPRFDALRKQLDLRAAIADGRIPDWVPTPLPTRWRATFPQRELVLMNFLRRVGEQRAVGTVGSYAGKSLSKPANRRKTPRESGVGGPS